MPSTLCRPDLFPTKKHESLMLKRDLAKWNQRPDDLREEAMNAPHARTRERFLALYELTQQGGAPRRWRAVWGVTCKH